MKKLETIRLLALDVDGVLTDGGIVIGQDGELCKRFHAQDGLGISCALRNDLIIAIITGRTSQIVSQRARELGITEIYTGIKDKSLVLNKLAVNHRLDLSQVAYMGDDLNDLPALHLAGYACAPANAVSEVQACADLVTQACGGAGAVREVIESILKARGIWEQVVASYVQKGQGDSQ